MDGAKVVSPVYRIPLSSQVNFSVEAESFDPMSTVCKCFFAGPENHLIPFVFNHLCQGGGETHIAAPLFVWGVTGSGKTYLSQGLAQRCQDNGQQVVFLQGKELNHRRMTAALKGAADGAMWIIDDMDCARKSTAVLENLCQLAERAIHGENKVVLTSSCPPAELISFSPRLRSRISAGLVVQLNQLSTISKQYILQQVVDHLKVDWNTSEKKEIFHRLISTNNLPREMIDCLLSGYATPNMVGVGEVLDRVCDSASGPPDQNFTLDDIASAVTRYFGLEFSDLTDRSRRCGIVLARQVFMFLSHRLYGYTKHRVADYLRRDPSTVSYGCVVIEKKNKFDSEIERHLSAIQRGLQKETIRLA